MKRLIVFMMMTTSIFCAKPEGSFVIEPKLGVNVNFTLDSEIFNIEAIKFYGAEFYYRATPRIDTGVGILYNIVETTKGSDTTTLKVTRLPVYFAVKGHLGDGWAVNPYLKLAIGKQFLLESDIEGLDDGEIYAIGFGLDIVNFTVEAVINVEENTGNEEFRGALGMGMAFGYRF